MLLDEILKIASDKNASDVLITIGISPKCRVNGELINIRDEKLSAEDTKNLIEPLLNEENKNKLEKKGEVDFSWSMPDIGRFRVNVFRQRGYNAMAIRLFPNIIPTPEELGMPTSMINLAHKKGGLILISGPTGSGKSTTAATLLDIINQTENVHVITIEDPIEFLHRHDKAIVNQREIGIDTFSYKEALKAALRENADVIFVGELLDIDSITVALTAAETGHLVISLMHTVGVLSTINRIIDYYPPYQQQQVRIQLASILDAVISQQLLPDIDGDGRVAAFEILYNNPEIQENIREGRINQIHDIMKKHRKDGMQTLDDAIYDLYLKKKISKNTLLQYSNSSLIIS